MEKLPQNQIGENRKNKPQTGSDNKIEEQVQIVCQEQKINKKQQSKNDVDFIDSARIQLLIKQQMANFVLERHNLDQTVPKQIVQEQNIQWQNDLPQKQILLKDKSTKNQEGCLQSDKQKFEQNKKWIPKKIKIKMKGKQKRAAQEKRKNNQQFSSVIISPRKSCRKRPIKRNKHLNDASSMRKNVGKSTSAEHKKSANVNQIKQQKQTLHHEQAHIQDMQEQINDANQTEKGQHSKVPLAYVLIPRSRASAERTRLHSYLSAVKEECSKSGNKPKSQRAKTKQKSPKCCQKCEGKEELPACPQQGAKVEGKQAQGSKKSKNPDMRTTADKVENGSQSFAPNSIQPSHKSSNMLAIPIIHENVYEGVMNCLVGHNGSVINSFTGRVQNVPSSSMREDQIDIYNLAGRPKRRYQLSEPPVENDEAKRQQLERQREQQMQRLNQQFEYRKRRLIENKTWKSRVRPKCIILPQIQQKQSPIEEEQEQEQEEEQEQQQMESNQNNRMLSMSMQSDSFFEHFNSEQRRIQQKKRQQLQQQIILQHLQEPKPQHLMEGKNNSYQKPQEKRKDCNSVEVSHEAQSENKQNAEENVRKEEKVQTQKKQQKNHNISDNKNVSVPDESEIREKGSEQESDKVGTTTKDSTSSVKSKNSKEVPNPEQLSDEVVQKKVQEIPVEQNKEENSMKKVQGSFPENPVL